MAVTIKGVEEGSPAQRAGLAAGMALLRVDGHDIIDGLDYEFYTTGARLEIEAEVGGKKRCFTAEKAEYQPLGCQFGSYLITPQAACRNRCVFCFIDQLPKGLRKSLYFKDDDARLGFLFGNYITLTNLTEREVDRIIAMRFSPVNISVHTANPALRARMMGNPEAGKALKIIPQLAAAGIEMNFQLVLCPGLNDGAELRRSIEWLAGFRPAAASIAAVPVGLTRHRQGLPHIAPYTAESAAAQLDIMLEAGERFAREDGLRLVYPADEWFLLAGRPMPPAEFYDGYPQLENGVGMWRLMEDEFTGALADAAADGLFKGAGRGRNPAPEADLATGTLAAPLLQKLAGQLAEKCPGAALHVHPVVNDFFGHGVTVAGLLTGGDIIAQLKGRLRSGRLLLPGDALRAEGDLLLDGTTPAEIGEALGVRVQVVPKGGEELLRAMLAPEGRA